MNPLDDRNLRTALGLAVLAVVMFVFSLLGYLS